ADEIGEENRDVVVSLGESRRVFAEPRGDRRRKNVQEELVGFLFLADERLLLRGDDAPLMEYLPCAALERIGGGAGEGRRAVDEKQIERAAAGARRHEVPVADERSAHRNGGVEERHPH